jgi:four helix bundle protein
VNRVAGQIRGSAHLSLRSQMIRAAMSIDANIVEGRGQKSEKEFARFLGYAVNSANELESHLIMARDVGAMGQTDFVALLEQLIEVRRMLHGLINKIGTTSVAVKHAAGS